MAHQVDWNSIIVEEFCRLALLTDIEEAILRTRIAGWSRTAQSQEFSISERSVDRIISSLKRKYDSVQKHSAILPPRITHH